MFFSHLPKKTGLLWNGTHYQIYLRLFFLFVRAAGDWCAALTLIDTFFFSLTNFPLRRGPIPAVTVAGAWRREMWLCQDYARTPLPLSACPSKTKLANRESNHSRTMRTKEPVFWNESQWLLLLLLASGGSSAPNSAHALLNPRAGFPESRCCDSSNATLPCCGFVFEHFEVVQNNSWCKHQVYIQIGHWAIVNPAQFHGVSPTWVHILVPSFLYHLWTQLKQIISQKIGRL